MTIPTTDEPQRLTWTPEEAAPRLGVGVKAVHALIRRGELPAVRVGRRWFVPRQALVEFIAGHRD